MIYPKTAPKHSSASSETISKKVAFEGDFFECRMQSAERRIAGEDFEKADSDTPLFER